MNILELHPIQTTVVHLKNPATGEEIYDGKKPVIITLKSTDCDAFINVTREILARESSKPAGEFRTAQQERNDQARQLAAVTVDWTGLDAPFSHDEAVALYSDERSRPYREQLFTALNALHESVGKPKAS